MNRVAGDISTYTREVHEYLGKRKAVYVKGSGPAVIVIEEIPGITPNVVGFADRVVDRGMTVFIPELFGETGRSPSGGYLMRTLARVCISREFTLLARGRPSPVTLWLRELAGAARKRTGGPGVGVIGMCLTGGFALAMMVDGIVTAPVLSQPSLPFPISKANRADLGLSEADRATIASRAAQGVCVLGLRFSGDKGAPVERFAALRELLGDAFISVELDSSPGNPYGHRTAAHSVLTEDLDDRDGTPTRAALDQTLRFLEERLVKPS